MVEVTSKYGNAQHHGWNWQCWDRLPIISLEGSIEEFDGELSLRFGLCDDSIEVRLQGDNLVAQLRISSDMGK